MAYTHLDENRLATGYSPRKDCRGIKQGSLEHQPLPKISSCSEYKCLLWAQKWVALWWSYKPDWDSGQNFTRRDCGRCCRLADPNSISNLLLYLPSFSASTIARGPKNISGQWNTARSPWGEGPGVSFPKSKGQASWRESPMLSLVPCPLLFSFWDMVMRLGGAATTGEQWTDRHGHGSHYIKDGVVEKRESLGLW